MSQIKDPRCASDETAWEGFDEKHVIFQRDCPDCDKGLIYEPVRFCGACGGSGFLTRTLPVIDWSQHCTFPGEHTEPASECRICRATAKVADAMEARG